MANPLIGKVIVASPDMPDEGFTGAELLLLRLTIEDVVSGIILNKPLTVNDIGALDTFPLDRRLVSHGGPMDSGILIVHDGKDVPCSMTLLPGVFGALTQLGRLPYAKTMLEAVNCRAFHGYAAWKPGQLEIEIGMGFWTVREFNPGADLWGRRP